MESENPYAAPLTVSEIVDQAELQVASQGRRFLNMIIDGLSNYALWFAMGFVAGRAGAGDAIDSIPGIVFGVIGTLVYYVPQELLWGRTLGKLLTGTRVVAANGGPATFGQIVGRTFARMIPFEAFSFFGGEGYPVGWHDSLSGTRVVMAR